MYDITFYISILKQTITKCKTFYVILAYALKVYAILFYTLLTLLPLITPLYH